MPRPPASLGAPHAATQPAAASRRARGAQRDHADTAWRVLSLALLAVAISVTVGHLPDRVAQDDPRIYVEAAQSITEGSYESESERSGLPRYPPGFPIMLAPSVALWGDDGALAMSALIRAGLVGLVWLAAERLGGHRAGGLAALLWALSPLVAHFSAGVMSDAAGAAFVMLAFLAALRGRWVLVGLALGWCSWIRLIHPVFLGGMGRRRAAWTAAVLMLVPLALFQLAVYGRLSGYEGDGAEFSLSFVFGGTTLGGGGRAALWPNWQFFPGLLWGLRGGLVPLLPLFAGYEMFVRRTEASTRLAAWIVVANVAVYLPYHFQASRFVFPAACLVIVFAAAGVVRLVDEVRASRRERVDVGSPGLADTPCQGSSVA